MKACLVAFLLLFAVACRTEAEVEQHRPTGSYTFRELLDACTRNDGITFLCEDDVERDFDKLGGQIISCFASDGAPEPTASDIADIEMVQTTILKARHFQRLDLMIDRYPLPGTNTYRIYRQPLGS